MSDSSTIVTTEQLNLLVNDNSDSAINRTIAPANLIAVGGDPRVVIMDIINKLNINIVCELNKSEYEVAFEVDCAFNQGHKKKSIIAKLVNGGFFYKCQGSSCSGNDWEELKKLLPSASVVVPNEVTTGDWDSEPLPIKKTQQVPELPVDLIPPSIRPYCKDLQGNLGASMDFIFPPLIALLSSILGRKVRMHPKRFDKSWVVVPNIFCMSIGGPGSKKSPALSQVMALLKPLEKKARDEYESALTDYNLAKASLDTKIDGAKAALKLATKAQKNISSAEKFYESLMKKVEAPPVEKRYKVMDATIEIVAVLVESNPSGLAVYIDELSSLFANFKKAGREVDRTFYLTSANGNESYMVDRIGRESVYIEGLCLSIIGTVQPEVLKKHMQHMKKTIGEDGTFQRFQFMLVPESIERKDQDKPVNKSLVTRMERLVQKFDNELQIPHFASVNEISKNDDGSINFNFDDDAQPVFFEWKSSIDEKTVDQSLPASIQAHYAKLPSLMPSIAVILFMMEWADSGSEFVQVNNFVRVQKQHAIGAAAVCDYLEKHMLKVYEMDDNPRVKGAEALLEKIRDKKVGESFKRNAVVKNNWEYLSTTSSVDDAIRVLVEHGWLKILQQPSSSGKGGRPSETIIVHPHFDDFQEVENGIPVFESKWLDQLRALKTADVDVDAEVDANAPKSDEDGVPVVDVAVEPSVDDAPEVPKALTVEDVFGVKP